jgi:RimJ/RimL family protein N-acetyltransferase
MSSEISIAPSPHSHEGPNIVIETERLTLRRPVATDAKIIAGLANDFRVAEHTARLPHPYRLEDATAFIASLAQRATEQAFLITQGGDAIGMIGLNFTDPSVPDLGYWLGFDAWGQGFATQAARAVVDHAFEGSTIGQLAAGARVINPASRRVLEKCGFRWTGVKLIRSRALGCSIPVDRLALDRAVWTSLKTWSNSRSHSRSPRDTKARIEAKTDTKTDTRVPA